jgi:lipopolysaccharide/colanic/teichoic acid biosynthesis glycosyltransferase
MEMRIKYDLYYINNWSLLFDLRIIAMTAWTVIAGRNAY